MKVLGVLFSVTVFASALIGGSSARADDDGPLLTGRSVATSAECDHVTPVCARMGGDRMVSYANECRARAEGALSVSFSGCFDEN